MAPSGTNWPACRSGRQVIASSPWQRLTGRSRSGTATARISGHIGPRSRAATGWSPEGSSFVFVRDGDAWLAQADGIAGVRNLTEFPLGGVTQCMVVAGRDSGSSCSRDRPCGRSRRTARSVNALVRTSVQATGAEGPDWGPAWSPDGESAALEHDQQTALFHVGDWRGVRLENAGSRRGRSTAGTWPSSRTTATGRTRWM